MQHDVTILANESVRQRLTTWLRERNCLPQKIAEARAAGAHCDGMVLITFLSGATELAEIVTADFLASLPRPLLWLQMSPLPEEDAHFLYRRAAASNAKFIHAPYFTDPRAQERPVCLVYEDKWVRDAVTPGACAATLIEALSWHSEWVGPLALDVEPRPERDTLAEYALLGHSQMAL